MTLTTHSEAETAAAGREFAARLQPGAVVLLAGDLGAGKTAFVRGMAEGIGIPPEDVNSPTFTLVQEYRGGAMTLFHVDLYRLRTDEVDDLGLDEMATVGGVIAIEWPDRLPRPFKNAVSIRIGIPGGNERRIHIEEAGLSKPGQPPPRP